MHFPRIAAALFCCGLAVPALAQNDVVPDVSDPITLRMTAMKQVGAAMGAMGAMAKGETEFDARVAELALRGVLAASVGYGGLFPEGTEEGHGTEAGPAIWSDREGFEAKLADLVSAAHAAVQAPPQDLQAMQAAMGSVGGTCRACHTDYRVRRD